MMSCFRLLNAFGLWCLLTAACPLWAEDKTEQVTRSPTATASRRFLLPMPGGSGHRTSVSSPEGEVRLPLIVLRGSPYDMGYHYGRLMRDEIEGFVPRVVAGLQNELGVSTGELQEAWSRSMAYGDDRVEQELAGVADGSGVPLATLQAMHAIPLLMPYSCSSIAAWGKATRDGHLYQTRNLDWNLEIQAHEVPVIVVYIPENGTPHVVPSFCGMVGAHTGLNARGIVLSEMGDSKQSEAPYPVHAPHFTALFRTLLYDADSLESALAMFGQQPQTKRYHYVFGDGQHDRRAVKIRAHSPEPLARRLLVWKDDDPQDEFAPNVLSCVVYNDEGRGAFPTLKGQHGQLDGPALVKLANQIPIKGGNVVNVVYDATALRFWVSYAKGDREAYQQPYVFVDLRTVNADGDGQPDLPK
jgi:isopenicillin-N N-acyltransferase-like protein